MSTSIYTMAAVGTGSAGGIAGVVWASANARQIDTPWRGKSGEKITFDKTLLF